MTLTEQIKILRETTQAGMMDCKKALEETNGNIEEATKWLREKGIAKAAKKLSAIAAEGIVAVVANNNNKAVIAEINCQTDFVAKSDAFVKLSNDITTTLLDYDIKTLQDANDFILSNDQSIKLSCDELTGKLGEKIKLRRFETMNKEKNQTFSFYQHANNRIATLILLEGIVDIEVAKNVAMHAAAMAPKFLNKNGVDQEWLNNETKVLIEQTIAEGKPKDFAEKIVKGRVGKLLAEVCLDDQPFVKDPSVTVAKYLANNNSKAIKYIRYEVGEGIEKKENNFADEVAEQMKAK